MARFATRCEVQHLQQQSFTSLNASRPQFALSRFAMRIILCVVPSEPGASRTELLEDGHRCAIALRVPRLAGLVRIRDGVGLHFQGV
jgi:hypothetical protein